MAAPKVYGFDEAGFRRVVEATQRVLKSPTVGSQRRRQAPVLGGQPPRLFVCVESPWYTASEMSLSEPYGSVVAAVQLPIVGGSGKVDTPTGLPSSTLFSSAVVTERDGEGFPTEAYVSIGGESQTRDVTKLYCGALSGRPYRSQIISAIPGDLGWWMTGAINPCLFGTVVDAMNVQLQNSTGGDVMPSADAEFTENAVMPAAAFSGFGAIDIGYAVDDVVVLQWIHDAYYIIPITCTETPL